MDLDQTRHRTCREGVCKWPLCGVDCKHIEKVEPRVPRFDPAAPAIEGCLSAVQPCSHAREFHTTPCRQCQRSHDAANARVPLPRSTMATAEDVLNDASLESLFRAMLRKIDPNPDRQGIAETPDRAAKAWKFWCGGYDVDVAALFKCFDDGAENYDQMVFVGNIPVHSHCEHHLAGIIGRAHVAYIPNNRVVGLSKLARVVDAFARRLQVQERLTVQVADAIAEHLQPLGVGVMIRAEHHCMTTRGVRVHGSLTTTSALRGDIKHEVSARQEFLSLCSDAERDAK